MLGWATKAPRLRTIETSPSSASLISAWRITMRLTSKISPKLALAELGAGNQPMVEDRLRQDSAIACDRLLIDDGPKPASSNAYVRAACSPSEMPSKVGQTAEIVNWKGKIYPQTKQDIDIQSRSAICAAHRETGFAAACRAVCGARTDEAQASMRAATSIDPVTLNLWYPIVAHLRHQARDRGRHRAARAGDQLCGRQRPARRQPGSRRRSSRPATRVDIGAVGAIHCRSRPPMAISGPRSVQSAGRLFPDPAICRARPPQHRRRLDRRECVGAARHREFPRHGPLPLCPHRHPRHRAAYRGQGVRRRDLRAIATRSSPRAAASSSRWRRPSSQGGADVEYVYRVPHPFCSVLYKSSPLDEKRMDVIAIFLQPMDQEHIRAHMMLSLLDDRTTTPSSGASS